MTFRPLTSYTDFPTDQTFHQFQDLNTELDLHRITSGFYGALETGVTCRQGTLTLPNTWFRPHILGLALLQLLRPDFPNLSCLYSTFTLNTPRYFLNFAFAIKVNMFYHFTNKQIRLIDPIRLYAHYLL